MLPTIDMDVWKGGFALSFQYNSILVERVKKCLGFRWLETHKQWVSDGPEVVLDMERYQIPYRPTPAARERVLTFYATLNELLKLKAEKPQGEYGYQSIGTRSLILQESGILADDMGLGKSKQAIDAVRKVGAERVLILAPKSLTYNWDKELAKWGDPTWTRAMVPEKGSAPARKAFWEGELPNVVIANYEKLILDDWPKNLKWDALIFDEAHKVKNRTTATHKMVAKVAANSTYRFALTGTPLEIKVEELFGIMSITRPAVFGTFYRFKQDHLNCDWMGNVTGIKAAPLLKERVGPWMTRRTKNEVLSNLPPKIYTPVYVDFSSEEQKLYNQICSGFTEWLESEGRLANRGGNVLTEIIRMQQFTSSPQLLGIDSCGWGSKYWELQNLIAQAPGRVLIFTRFSTMARYLQEWMELPARAIITGDVTDPKERLARIGDFNQGNLGKVFVGTDAMGVGLDVLADTVVHYDKLWNPAKEWQREDRCHGIGRGIEGVHTNVYHMLVKDTIDEGMHAVTTERTELFQDIIDGAEDVMVKRFSTADFERMVRGGK